MICKDYNLHAFFFCKLNNFFRSLLPITYSRMYMNDARNKLVLFSITLFYKQIFVAKEWADKDDQDKSRGQVIFSIHYSWSNCTLKAISAFFLKEIKSLSLQKPSFDSAQDDVTLSGVEVWQHWNSLCIKYRSVYKMKLNKMGPLGLEPRTHGLWVRCSNQLSYGPRNDLWSDQVLYFIIIVTSFELNLRPLICKQREGVYQFFVLVSSVLFYSGYSQETN